MRTNGCSEKQNCNNNNNNNKNKNKNNNDYYCLRLLPATPTPTPSPTPTPTPATATATATAAATTTSATASATATATDAATMVLPVLPELIQFIVPAVLSVGQVVGDDQFLVVLVEATALVVDQEQLAFICTILFLHMSNYVVDKTKYLHICLQDA